MALTQQYGFGVLPFGTSGFGSFAEQYAEQSFMATDAPVLAYRNVLALAGSTTLLTIGSDALGSISKLYDGDMLHPANVSPELGIAYTTNNLALYSEQLDNAYWTKFNCSVVPNSSGTLDKIVENSVNSFHFVSRNFSVTPAASYVLSCRAKAAERNIIGLQFGAGIIQHGAKFNLSTGTLISNSTLEAGIVNLGGGEYRCWVRDTMEQASKSPLILIGNGAYLGDGSSGLFVGEVQLQNTDHLMPYIATQAQPITYTQYDPNLNMMQLVWSPVCNIYRYGFGAQSFGAEGFGGYGAKAEQLDCLIFGAARHDAAGLRSVPTRYRLWAESGFGEGGFGLGSFGGSLLDRAETTPANASLLRQFQPLNAVRVTLTMWGLPSIATLPELFLGKTIQMPFLEIGFDPYIEVSTGQSFLAESGREYPQLRYRKLELSPKWSYIAPSLWPDLNDLRENAFELKQPVWFGWMPNTRPTEVYYMRSTAKSVPFPYINALYRSLSLSLAEVL